MSESDRCHCHTKLVEIQKTIVNELHDCKEHVWNFQITNLQKERDELLLKNNNLKCQLARIQSKIVSDPFMSKIFYESGTSDLDINDVKPVNEADAYRQLTIYAEHNKELEERLSCEQLISMSWKHKFNDLEAKIGRQINELLELVQGRKCLSDVDYNMHRSEHYFNVAKEALELLKLAKARIEGDRSRLESYMKRVEELEDKLSQSRLDAISSDDIIRNSLMNCKFTF